MSEGKKMYTGRLRNEGSCRQERVDHAKDARENIGKGTHFKGHRAK